MTYKPNPDALRGPVDKDKLAGLRIGLPSRRAAPKQTVDHTDDTINTVTEHYYGPKQNADGGYDRTGRTDDGAQDVHVQVRRPIGSRKKD